MPPPPPPAPPSPAMVETHRLRGMLAASDQHITRLRTNLKGLFRLLRDADKVSVTFSLFVEDQTPLFVTHDADGDNEFMQDQRRIAKEILVGVAINIQVARCRDDCDEINRIGLWRTTDQLNALLARHDDAGITVADLPDPGTKFDIVVEVERLIP